MECVHPIWGPTDQKMDGRAGERQGQALVLTPRARTVLATRKGRQARDLVLLTSLLTEVPASDGPTLFLIFLRIFFRAFSSDFVRGNLVGIG